MVANAHHVITDKKQYLSQSEIGNDTNAQILRAAICQAHEKFSTAVLLNDKAQMQQTHQQARDLTRPDTPLVWNMYEKYHNYFADGLRIDPQRIEPRLIPAPYNSKWSDVFRVVRETWSMPYSKGYGRRVRFVVFDDFHECVIGIIGLQSPAADIGCRDQLFAYPEGKKLQYVNRTMDVYTAGAIPPYSNLLGGKLVAGLICANEVRQEYWRRYAGKRSELMNQQVDQPLIAATTTSLYGRSSIYNRLKYANRLLANPIGYTKGYGTIHLEHLYKDCVRLLSRYEPVETGGYGVGPRIRWQIISRTLTLLGLPTR